MKIGDIVYRVSDCLDEGPANNSLGIVVFKIPRENDFFGPAAKVFFFKEALIFTYHCRFLRIANEAG